MSSPHLPPELLDRIVDLLRGTVLALRNCCLVSKSWVPRTRKHLFAYIRFITAKDLQSWKKAFPDPSTSPAHYTKTLLIDCPEVFTAADAGDGSWIRGFSQVERLEVNSASSYANESAISLLPLHGLSPALKYLRVIFAVLPSSRVFDLILSFPLLHDLTVIAFYVSIDDGGGPNGSQAAQPSSPPAFTGSLDICLKHGMEPITRRLLSLPSGIHFRKLKLTWNHEQDLSLTTPLVEGCSGTLESLDITSNPFIGPGSASVDFSRATRLRDVSFLCGRLGAEWVSMALRTVTPSHRNLQQISLSVPHVPYDTTLDLANPADVRRAIGEVIYEQWLELDRVLVQLSESHSIRPKVLYYASAGKDEGLRSWVGSLLPETTRGSADLVNQRW